MPSRVQCSASAGLRVASYNSFGKRVEPPTPTRDTSGRQCSSLQIRESDKLKSVKSCRISSSSNSVQRQKSVRFVEDVGDYEDDNSVNEMMEQCVVPDTAAADMEPLYATVRKRNSPTRERSGTLPQVPLNIQPGREFHEFEEQRGFRPYRHEIRHMRQNTDTWIHGYKGDFCPEILERQMQVLEARYGGRFIAHRAATVIQRGWRDYVLRNQFSRVLSLAKSVENVNCSGNRRRSILGGEQLTNRSILGREEEEQQQLTEVEINVDSGDVMMTSSPSARMINNRRQQQQQRRSGVSRSSSLRDHRRSGSWSGGFEPIDRPGERPCHCGGGGKGGGEQVSNNSMESSKTEDFVRPKTAVDLQNKMNQAREMIEEDRPTSPTGSPVPPCPPLRGVDFYPDHEPVYLTRDSLYCSVRRPRRLPPRPPQRTVSFLVEPQHQPPTDPAYRPVSVSDSTLPRLQHLQQQQEEDEVDDVYEAVHQDYSSLRTTNTKPTATSLESTSLYLNRGPPRNEKTTRSKRSPLPPPPYIPPPVIREPSSEPLPPPPPELVLDRQRQPCDSVSSIDSGFRSSSCSDSTSSAETDSIPTSPHGGGQVFSEIPEDPYSYWVSSPNFITSPESASFYRSTVTSTSSRGDSLVLPSSSARGPPSSCHGPNCCCDSRPNVFDPYQTDVYGQLVHQSSRRGEHHLHADQTSRSHAEQSKSKKTVRIQLPESATTTLPATSPETDDDETVRRRNYRVGLNLFNSNPEQGITYLAKKDFIDVTPAAVAKFLIGRKGLSKKMVGEYICNLQKPFNLAVLHSMVYDMDFSGLHLDIALRQLLSEIHIPGEAQKIEKLVEVFSRRYIECNQMFVAGFKSPDTIFILSYAMVLLNTDLHNKSIKPERKMRQEDFLRNLRGIDAGNNVDTDMLKGIYDRIKAAEFKEGPDHVSQVCKVQDTIAGNKRPKLNATWRRLVCFCRVTEVADMHKKDKKDSHQRGIFLFNDLLVVTKSEKSSRKKQVHQFRSSLNLAGLRVNMFRTQQHQFGVQLQSRHTGKVAATFACRSYNDQQRFVADLQESIAEVEEMERARLFL